MNDKQFEQTYCSNCGSQRCEGIGTEWFEGCKYRWNHDSYDAAAEIERLNRVIMNMTSEKIQFGRCVIQEVVRRIELHTPRGLLEVDDTDMECVREAVEEFYEELPKWMASKGTDSWKEKK